jgi:hypothetical protein
MDSYGVVWQKNGRELVAGKLEIGVEGLRLEGGERDDPAAVYLLAYPDLTAVRIDREPVDRLDGRLALSLESSSGDTIRIAALTQAGIVSEIAERLAGLEAGRPTTRLGADEA